MTESKKAFFPKVIEGGKITIPVEIRELLGIEVGDTVEVSDIRKVEKGEVE